jgi:asparagine synthetase B (glutamine-hydrolysing)
MNSAVASTAELAARAIAGDGEAPERDTLAVAGLAFTRDRVGTRTGFVGVQTLPPGSTLELVPGRSPRVRERPRPWLPDASMADLAPADQVERAALEVEDEVRFAPTYPAERHLADLTGGLDSRAVLAAVLSAGCGDAYTFATDGSPQLSDVQIAQELAQLFSRRHESGLRTGDLPGGPLGTLAHVRRSHSGDAQPLGAQVTAGRHV